MIAQDTPNRLLRIQSPLGDSVLLPHTAQIAEGVSTLFEINLTVATKRETIKPEDLIGSLMDVSVLASHGQNGAKNAYRFFNGFVTQIEEGALLDRAQRRYRITLRPQLWLLSQRSDCRIWKDHSALDILDTLLREHGLPAADVSGVVCAPEKQDYSVQWNESDLDYLLRRFEQSGLFYWFEHREGAHKLVVADNANSWRGPSAAAGGCDEVVVSGGTPACNHISKWKRSFNFVPGARAGADWNFETPSAVPLATTPSLVQMPKCATRELFEFPAGARDVGAAERAQKLRMQACEADHETVMGQSDVVILEPGRYFTPICTAGSGTVEERHVITAITHEIVDGSHRVDSGSNGYTNHFTAVPARVAMTPHRSTPRPRIHGTQVAIVAGPKGEEIEVDSYGRVKLWFPWDRNAKKDGSDTCWVRVAQSWAGPGFGSQIIPRIGMEVMCAFIDGDPDRPLVTGVVPNGANAVPENLPAEKTKSVFRTKTHKGQGFNELSFEDRKDQEEIYLHAQKDHRLHIRNDRRKVVENDQYETIDKNKSIKVGENHDEIIGKIKTLAIGDRYEVTVGKSRLVMSKDGTIQISGTKIALDADQSIDLSAATINIQAKAALSTKAKITNMVSSLIQMTKG